MFCLDWKDNDPFELLGAQKDDDFIRFDIVLNPCNYLHTMFDYKDDSVSSECVPDLSEQIKYMGPSHIITYVNTEKINPVAYGDEIIDQYSELQTV